MIRQVVAAVGCTVAVQVIIRPRGGDFLFSEDEAAVMLGRLASWRNVPSATRQPCSLRPEDSTAARGRAYHSIGSP